MDIKCGYCNQVIATEQQMAESAKFQLAAYINNLFFAASVARRFMKSHACLQAERYGR